MTNLFREATKPWDDGFMILIIFWGAVIAFIIGAVHLVEDISSSYLGYQELVAAFAIVPVTWEITWFTLAAAPTVGTLISWYMYMSDTSRRSWLAAGMFFFGIDFVSDFWHRAGDGLIITNFFDALGFAMTGEGASIEMLPATMAFIVAAAFTFFAYTVGAEFFIVVGLGIIGESYEKAAEQWGAFRAAIIEVRATIGAAKERGKARAEAIKDAAETRTRNGRR